MSKYFLILIEGCQVDPDSGGRRKHPVQQRRNLSLQTFRSSHRKSDAKDHSDQPHWSEKLLIIYLHSAPNELFGHHSFEFFKIQIFM
jgi:hypothetical protein